MNHLMLIYNMIYAALAAAGILFFAWIFLSTRRRVRETPISVSAWKRRENAWMYVVVGALAIALVATIFETPWRASAQSDRQRVNVVARQFGFDFSSRTLHAGRQVEFHLSSGDVNHAMAIYGPDGVFVAQSQAMPDHPQDLRVTFDRPGLYTVRCFEYCGVGHHIMETTFRVVR